MLDLPVTLATASILTLLFLVLSVRVSMARMGAGVSLGEGGHSMTTKSGSVREVPSILAPMRAQGNFAEYVPLSLLMLALIEAHAAARGALIAIAIALVASRVMHAIGIGLPAPNPMRAGGAGLQYLVLLVLGGYGIAIVAVKLL